ncbi:MAG: hypothetical protein KF909_01315 [Rhodocyclaceae bacterium]|nr:hypothetical protein [Rhodocyclaceae bacterium]MCP5231396.1 hypothetical protein [Zoogloeaceae bacterium]MCB1913494.1 hypothetical protein [Rhodocyclaceae bacterium]MCP5240877.1 hypothetical protein [Zoogloeaceae bacterium]MCP5255317.1 hypothetical protein [Zoogloeaceae bacterium]
MNKAKDASLKNVPREAPAVVDCSRVLAGVDNAMCPRADRSVAWPRLGSDLKISKPERIPNEPGLAEAVPMVTQLL